MKDRGEVEEMIYIIFSGLCPSLSGEGKFLCLDAVSSIRETRIPSKIHAQINDNVRTVYVPRKFYHIVRIIYICRKCGKISSNFLKHLSDRV